MQVVDRAGVVFTGSEDGTVCALNGDDGEQLWKHERHTRRVVEVNVCDGIVFSVADDQTTRAIEAKTGTEMWCSRWAWGRHGPPPDRGNIWTRAVNWTEKKTGLDLDGDGDVGEIGGETQVLSKIVNKVEAVTGLDIDGDGDVGEAGDNSLERSLASLGLGPSSSWVEESSRTPVKNGSPNGPLSPLPGSPSSPLPSTEELLRQLNGFKPSPGSPGYPKLLADPDDDEDIPAEMEVEAEDLLVPTPREIVHARDAWEDAKQRVRALEASIEAEKESLSWVTPVKKRKEALRQVSPAGSSVSSPGDVGEHVELSEARHEWEAAKR